MFKPTNDAGNMLSLSFEHSDVLWPWSGYLAIYISVLPEAGSLDAVAAGQITFDLVSPPAKGSTEVQKSGVVLPIKVQIMPTPPRYLMH